MSSRVSVLNHGLGIVPDFDAHTKNESEILRTGEYFTGYTFGDSGNFSLSANTLYASPFLVARTTTWDRIAMIVTTLAAGASARLGIYNNGTNLYPGTLLLDAGTVSVASTGVKAITISQQLAKGIYWLAAVSDGAPVSLSRRGDQAPMGIRATDFDYSQGNWSVAFSYAALPDPFTGGGALHTTWTHIMALRLLSLD